MDGNILLEAYLKKLRLPAIKREYKQLARTAAEEKQGYAEFLEQLAALETNEREKRATSRRIKEAGFPVIKEFADFDFSAIPGLNKHKVLELGRSDYMEKHENVVFVGNSGVGKTHLAIALGLQACRHGKKVRFFTAAELVNTYIEAREEKEIRRLEKHIQKRDLLVVDELGYIPFSRKGAENLFGFISQCYERTSVIITTNLPFSEWLEPPAPSNRQHLQQGVYTYFTEVLLIVVYGKNS